jgi:LmbE family N-acetylglucosaminyl deacetylase
VTEQRIRLLAVFAHPDDDVYTIGGTWCSTAIGST